MSQQIINISTPDDGLGDALRNGFDKTNQNFTELYNGKVDKITGKGLSENDFTDADKAKLDGIESGAEVNVQADFGETDPSADSYILNKPPSLYSSFGYFHYSDLATQTTPLVVLPSVPKKLTNDTLGTFTNRDQAPYLVQDVWDDTTNELTFASLDLGDAAHLRVDLSITTTSVNQTLELYVKFGVGTPAEYDLLIDKWNEKIVVTDEEFVKGVSFSIDNEDWQFAPAEIYILSDDDATVKVNGWYIPIIKKSVNIVSFAGGEDFLSSIVGTYDTASLPLDNTDKLIVFQSGVAKEVAKSNLVGNIEVENDLYRSFFQYSARNDAAGIVALNAPIALVTSGTQSVVGISGTSKYTSLPLQNYLSATPNGSNCGWKQGTLSDGVIRQGFDIYMIWANNDANVNCQTLVGSYSLTAAIPNLAVSSFTGDFFGVSNDVGDSDLSFYAHRVPASGQTASYTKVATNSSFPANDTTSSYLLRMEAPCTEVEADRYIKMTLTNIITGATISHTFPYTETPVLNRNILCVINRNNRNTGVATNIRPSKIHYSRLIY